MGAISVVGRALLAALVIAAALVAGNALRTAREGAPTPGPDAALAAASPSPSPAAANCVALARNAPIIPPALRTDDLANGTQRITSAEGGYSVVVPAGWLVSPGVLGPAAYGQAHITSYDPKTAPTPDPERWMLPPSVGIALDIQVWMNSDRVAPERFAENIHIGPDQSSQAPGRATTIDGQPAYTFTIADEHRFQPVDRPLVVTRQTRVIWLVQSRVADRVIVVYATPGESSLLPTAEDAVARMSITSPVAAARPVVHQRDEVLKQWLYDKTGALIAGRRAEAKLMTYAEANTAMNLMDQPVSPGAPKPIQLLRIDHDPDDLYWLVAVSGPDLPQPRGGPARAPATGTPTPTAWMLYDTSATGANLAGTGMRLSTQGTWPRGFDALPDRCR